MKRRLGLVLLMSTMSLVGCDEQMGDYLSATSFSKNGFARSEARAGNAHGQLIKIWGFVDHGNLYGDDAARAILGEWWSGYGPSDTIWRFDLKANEDDETGHSMSVWVPNDPGRDAILAQFVSDARSRRQTKVFLSARVFAFDAPTNILTFSSLYMELESSADILLELPVSK